MSIMAVNELLISYSVLNILNSYSSAQNQKPK